MRSVSKQETDAFVDSFIIDLARGTVGIMELIVQESRERQQAIREAKRRRAVRLIDRAVKNRKRITRDRLAKYVRAHGVTDVQLAEILQIPVPHLKQGLKRWYHIF